MPNRWPLVPLGEVLTKSEEWTNLQADARYHEVTVRLWGKGVTLRRDASGAEIATKRRIVVHANQFILSRIDARNGAFGLIPASLEGAIVSNDFPVFTPNPQRVLPSFLEWMTKTNDFVEICKAASEGTTNRVRLKEDRFLAMEIPLPPLGEQRWIVARIAQLAAKIRKARHFRDSAVIEGEALWPSVLAKAFRPAAPQRPLNEETAEGLLLRQAKQYQGEVRTRHNNAHPWQPAMRRDGPYRLPSDWVWTDLGSVVTHLIDCVNDTPDFTDSDTGLLGLKSTNVRPYSLDLSERWFVTPDDFNRWNRREQPQSGDLILTREAPMGNACVFPARINACLTQRLMLLRSDQAFVDRWYLLHFLNSPNFTNQVLDSCRGLTTPHIRVQDAPIIEVPLAPLSEQRRIVAYLGGLQAKVDALKRHQAVTAAELDALLPSILDKAFEGEL